MSKRAAVPFSVPSKIKLQSLLRWAEITFGRGYVIPLRMPSFFRKLNAFGNETEFPNGGILEYFSSKLKR